MKRGNSSDTMETKEYISIFYQLLSTIIIIIITKSSTQESTTRARPS